MDCDEQLLKILIFMVLLFIIIFACRYHEHNYFVLCMWHMEVNTDSHLTFKITLLQK